MREIRISTASWTDPGFADWYPTKLRAPDRLRWYAEHFDLVEVNVTFYRLPEARTVERWADQTPHKFTFDIKLPKVLSRHSMKAEFLPPEIRAKVETKNGTVQPTRESEKIIVERLLRELKPLEEADKLGAFLLQMSPAFSPKQNALSELDGLWDLFGGYVVAVELRNRYWITGDQFQRTVDYFRDCKITLVLLDTPESEHFTIMPAFDVTTNPKLGYFRAYGRNAKGFINGRSVAERFDYDYSPEEVEEIAARLRQVSEEVDRLHIIANNNRSDYAPKLAAALQEKLGLQRELQRTPTVTQAKLF
jgi:uncharacterized protein YecE (DUF72 family)